MTRGTLVLGPYNVVVHRKPHVRRPTTSSQRNQAIRSQTLADAHVGPCMWGVRGGTNVRKVFGGDAQRTHVAVAGRHHRGCHALASCSSGATEVYFGETLHEVRAAYMAL